MTWPDELSASAEFTVDQLAYQYGDIALRIVGVRTPDVSGGGQ
ncbi:hypothetical protein [Streptomyces sp. NPDC055134]